MDLAQLWHTYEHALRSISVPGPEVPPLYMQKALFPFLVLQGYRSQQITGLWKKRTVTDAKLIASVYL